MALLPILRLPALFLLGLLLWPLPATAEEVETQQEIWELEAWSRPFDFDSPSAPLHYRPLQKAERKWRICAAYPHLKDSYWLSVNYGMVEEAKRLGVALRVVEAGGYPNRDRQEAQIRLCAREADALALGAVSVDGLTAAVVEIAKSIPVIAVVNDIADPGISAKAGVSWVEIARQTGLYLAKRHPLGSEPVKLAWFPGPKESSWAYFVDRGLREGLADSSAEIVLTKWGDTGREIQVRLIEEALEERPDVDYIVGSAVTAGAAVSLLRARGLTGRIKVLGDYFTHTVYRGIKRGKILAAPTDFPALQGRLGIEMAVRVLEGKLVYPMAGPAIRLVDSENLEAIDPRRSLAPASFTPTFVVE